MIKGKVSHSNPHLLIIHLLSTLIGPLVFMHNSGTKTGDKLGGGGAACSQNHSKPITDRGRFVFMEGRASSLSLV